MEKPHPKSWKKLAICCPMIWYGRWFFDFFLIRKFSRELLFFKKIPHLLHLKYLKKTTRISCLIGMTGIFGCNSSIRVCLPDLCSFYLQGAPFGESLVGGIDVKMTFHRQRWNATIVQHSILCLLPIRKFLELIYSDEVLYLIYAFLMLQGSVGIPFFFGSFFCFWSSLCIGFSCIKNLQNPAHTRV